MAISTDAHIKILYGYITVAIVGFYGGLIMEGSRLNDSLISREKAIAAIKYDHGIELTRLNESVKQLIEVVNELKVEVKKGNQR